MKRIFYFLIALFAVTAPSVYAQDAATTKGDVLLDIGVGFWGGPIGYSPRAGESYTWNYDNANRRVEIPTLSIALQKAFWNDVTIGGQFAFNLYNNEHDLRQNDGYYQHSVYSQTNLYFLGRGEYHFGRLIGWGPKADLYAGALAGVRVSSATETQIYEGWGNGQPGSWRNDYPNRSTGSVGPNGGVFGGVRYYFAGNMAVYAEVGAGINFIRTGLAWRL